MEYRIHATGSVTEEQIWQAIRKLLRQSGMTLSLMGHSRDISVSLVAPTLSTARSRSALTGVGANSLFSSSVYSPAQAPVRVSFTRLSTWGGATTHYFWTSPSRLLTTDSAAFHARWQNPVGNWHQGLSTPPISFPAIPHPIGQPNPKPVAQMTELERLAEAIRRGILLLPEHIKRGAIEWFTPANVAIFAGLTVLLLSSGIGEVLGVGLLALGALMGGIDLCVNVLKMLFDFYRQATRATSETGLDQAAELFAAILLRGGMDIIDILVGRRALTKLAGRGVRGVGAYLAYLEEEMKLWRGRQGGGTVAREQAEIAAVKPSNVPAVKPAQLPAKRRGIPRRKRKNSLKTRPRRARANTDNMDQRRGGHSKGKHGTQVSPKQHEDRLRTGRDPQTKQIPVDKKGKPIPPPNKSSGFDTNEKHLEALGKADAKLNEGLANGTLTPDKNGKIPVSVDVKDAGTSYSLNPPKGYINGKVVTTKVHKAKAVYKLDPATGQYKLITLFPE